MKKHFNYLVLVIFILIGSLQYATAQTNDEVPKDLKEFISEIEKAYMNMDAEKRASGFIADGVHVTGWGERVKGQENILQLYQKTFSTIKEMSKIKAIIDHVTVFDNYAAGRGRFIWNGETNDGKRFTQEINMAALFEKVNGEWKIVWDLTGANVPDEKS